MITWLASLFHAIANGLESERADAEHAGKPTLVVFVENVYSTDPAATLKAIARDEAGIDGPLGAAAKDHGIRATFGRFRG